MRTVCSTEQWRPAVGWEGVYEVSSRGQVRSLPRVIRQRTRYGGVMDRAIPGGLMAALPRGKGYRAVMLRHDGRARVEWVHRLVAGAFLGPKPDGMVVCHNNSDPADNRLENLRYDTQRGNLQDRRELGTDPVGERNGRARLSEADVRLIRARAHQTQAVLAAEFGVCEASIWNVVHRKTWSHVQ